MAGGYATICHELTERCPVNDPDSNPAAFPGAELRRARVAAGLASQEALAVKLGYDRSVIAKAGTGERPPAPGVADALDAELFPGGPAGFVARLAKLARRADGPVPSWFESWLEAEREAHMLRLWSPVLEPGLLQTAGVRIKIIGPNGPWCVPRARPFAHAANARHPAARGDQRRVGGRITASGARPRTAACAPPGRRGPAPETGRGSRGRGPLTTCPRGPSWPGSPRSARPGAAGEYVLIR